MCVGHIAGVDPAPTQNSIGLRQQCRRIHIARATHDIIVEGDIDGKLIGTAVCRLHLHTKLVARPPLGAGRALAAAPQGRPTGRARGAGPRAGGLQAYPPAPSDGLRCPLQVTGGNRTDAVIAIKVAAIGGGGTRPIRTDPVLQIGALPHGGLPSDAHGTRHTGPVRVSSTARIVLPSGTRLAGGTDPIRRDAALRPVVPGGAPSRRAGGALIRLGLRAAADKGEVVPSAAGFQALLALGWGNLPVGRRARLPGNVLTGGTAGHARATPPVILGRGSHRLVIPDPTHGTHGGARARPLQTEKCTTTLHRQLIIGTRVARPA